MEEKSNKSNKPNTERKPGKKPYYKKRYTPQPAKKKFWNADKIVSLSAMAIALFTLVVLLYQSNILERQYELTVKQQKASVLPYIQFTAGFSSESFHITIENKGLGPAFIKGLYVKEKDSTFMLINLKDYYDDNIDEPMYSYNISGLYKGVVLAPGDKTELLSAGGGSTAVKPVKEFFDDFFSGQRSNVFIIEYESVFGDVWVVESSLQHASKEEYGAFEIFYDKVQ